MLFSGNHPIHRFQLLLLTHTNGTHFILQTAFKMDMNLSQLWFSAAAISLLLQLMRSSERPFHMAQLSSCLLRSQE